MKKLLIFAVLAFALASGTAAVTVVTGTPAAHADTCSGSSC